MPVYKLRQIINRPVSAVFETVIRVERFPEWSPKNHKSARRLTDGEIGEGARFELEIKGFGKIHNHLAEFERNKRVNVVPDIEMMGGGHRFLFTAEGSDATRIDHEVEMLPKGIFKLMTPFIFRMGKKNVDEVTAALKAYLEKD
jgi:Polyketide cyclase / dehydrase and lipid transport